MWNRAYRFSPLQSRFRLHSLPKWIIEFTQSGLSRVLAELRFGKDCCIVLPIGWFLRGVCGVNAWILVAPKISVHFAHERTLNLSSSLIFFFRLRAYYYPLDYQIGFHLVYPPYLDHTCAWIKFCSVLIRHWSVVKNRSHCGWIREDTRTDEKLGNVLLNPTFLKRVYHMH